MTPEADHIQFSRQIWQAVSEHAQRCIARRDIATDQARIENLRPVYFEEEDETRFGKQIWCFEAMGVTSDGRRQVLYGLMEFSIQFGLLESSQSGLFADASQRDQFLSEQTCAFEPKQSLLTSTKVMIAAASIGVAALAILWICLWVRFINMRSGSGTL